MSLNPSSKAQLLMRLRNDVMLLVREALRDRGFSKPKLEFGRTYVFVKSLESANVAIAVDFVRNPNSWMLTVGGSTTVLDVAQLLGKSKDVNYSTYACGTGDLVPGRVSSWSLDTENDAKPVADSIIAAVDSLLLPVLHKYATVESLYGCLVRNDEETRRLCLNKADRAAATVAAAFLSGRQHLCSQLAHDCEQQLRAQSSSLAQAFLADFLAFKERFFGEHPELK